MKRQSLFSLSLPRILDCVTIKNVDNDKANATIMSMAIVCTNVRGK